MQSSESSGPRREGGTPSWPADVLSPDAIIKALYDAISFRPGAQPDYDRLKMLFHPAGRLIPPKGEKDPHVPVLDLETFSARSREIVVLTGLERRGFCEREIRREISTFGNICHAFSTYESRHTPHDATVIQRGINSIQLVRDSGRWWVLTILWDVESVKNPMPKAALS